MFHNILSFIVKLYFFLYSNSLSAHLVRKKAPIHKHLMFIFFLLKLQLIVMDLCTVSISSQKNACCILHKFYMAAMMNLNESEIIIFLKKIK